MTPLPVLLVLATIAFQTAHSQEGAATLPRVNITGALAEDQPADVTGRPDWTSARRFPTTRVYLQQGPGEVGFEQWVRLRDYRDGTDRVRFEEELEFGLPYRIQLDLYESWVSDERRHAHQDETSFEIRWAPANWGKIPLNPTLYAEYAVVDHDANTLEFKLLLGQDLFPRVHWGANFVVEQGVSHEHSTELAFTQGVSYTCIDELLSIGVEMEYSRETVRGHRGEPEEQFLIGPSIQVRPTPRTHFDLVALIGTTDDAPDLEGYLIFGVELGKLGGGDERGYQPVSLRGASR